MKTVDELLRVKGHHVVIVPPNETVFEAIKTMADNNIGSLVVIDNDKIVGIFTERDYARNVILKGHSSPTTSVQEVMTRKVLCTTPDSTVDECMALMTEKRVRHLPVLDNKQLVGVISIGDLVKAIIAEQKFIIKQLEHYIHG